MAKRLADPDVAAWPNLVHVLHYPKNHEAWFDIITNEVDGDWYEERNPITLAPNIDIPVWLQLDQGRGWTLDGTIELFDTLKGPKKLDIGPTRPMQSRPFVEEHDKMFRWYDYWLKGIDNGIMDEPAVTVFVEGSRATVTGRAVAAEGRRAPAAVPASAPQAVGRARARWASSTPPRTASSRRPLTVTDQVEILSWSTAPFDEPTEMIGTGAAHLFAEIDQDDTNFILRLWDAAPERQAPARHHGLPQGLAPGARRPSARPRATRTTRTPVRCRSSRV